MRYLFALGLCLLVEANIFYIPSTKTPPNGRAKMVSVYNKLTNSIVIFGGCSNNTYFNDLWSFDIISLIWEEIHPNSEIIPSSRAYCGGFASNKNKKLYIYGGNSQEGLKNDLWEFDFISLRWTYIPTINFPSLRFAFVSTYYTRNSVEYFAIFGGGDINALNTDLHILNMSSFIWEEQPNNGLFKAYSRRGSIFYYNDCFYVVCGDPCYYFKLYMATYRYCLDEKIWLDISNPKEQCLRRKNFEGIIYKDFYYILAGEDDWFVTSLRLNLKSEEHLWEEFPFSKDYYVDSYGIVLVENTAYLFGGIYNSYMNSIVKADLISRNFYLIAENFLSPGKRMKASIVVINGELHMFGGIHKDIFYSDLWIFNTENKIWRSQVVIGDGPSPRYSHAVDSDGDAMILFGGEDALGLNDDLYIYNSLNYNWKKIIPKAKGPKPSKGACVVLQFPIVYIFGGITTNGLTSEFWKLNLITLEYTQLKSYAGEIAYMLCYIDNEGFHVAQGMFENLRANSGYAIYSFLTGLWKYYYLYETYYSDGIKLFMNDTFIQIGGQAFLIEVDSVIVIYRNGSSYINSCTYPYVYYSAHIHYKDRVYSFGGGLTVNKYPAYYYGTKYFYYIDLKDLCTISQRCISLCSKGTYTLNERCVPCDIGYYSDTQGRNSCIPCPPGTYNFNRGASSYRQCYPCPSGSFNDKNGSSICFDCPSDFYCPIGSTQPIDFINRKTVSSVQPQVYTGEDSGDIIIFYIILSSILYFLVIICLFTLKKIRDKIKIFDLFTEKHNHVFGVPMIKVKTIAGGAFSLIFIAIAIVYVGSTLISFKISNIQETKALVPLIILENDNELLTSNRLIVTSEIIGYGGVCGVDGICNSQISINATNLKGSLIEYNCTILYDNICSVTVTCIDCALLGEATIFIAAEELKSYASAITVNITSDSSIPNEVSNINYELSSTKNYIFIGSEASVFYFIMTPSLFTSESSRWPSLLTGYHVSKDKVSVRGSESSQTDLPINVGLKIFIYMYKSSTGLYTQRILKQSYLLLVSSVIGSVFGVMSLIGFLMEFSEGLFMKCSKKSTNIKNLPIIARKNKEIRMIYFESINKKEKKPKKNKNQSADVIPMLSESFNTSKIFS